MSQHERYHVENKASDNLIEYLGEAQSRGTKRTHDQMTNGGNSTDNNTGNANMWILEDDNVFRVPALDPRRGDFMRLKKEYDPTQFASEEEQLQFEWNCFREYNKKLFEAGFELREEYKEQEKDYAELVSERNNLVGEWNTLVGHYKALQRNHERLRAKIRHLARTA